MKFKELVIEQLATKPFGGWVGITMVLIASILIVLFAPQDNVKPVQFTGSVGEVDLNVAVYVALSCTFESILEGLTLPSLHERNTYSELA